MSRLVVLGAGLMGPAVAAEAMASSEIAEVGLCDQSPAQLDAALASLASRPGAAKLRPACLDLADRAAAVARGLRIGTQKTVRWPGYAEMVDRWSDGFTAMARTTGFTASVVARMIARGEIAARGVQRPEAAVAGATVDQLLRELGVHGIRVTLDEEPPRAAGETDAPPAALGPPH